MRFCVLILTIFIAFPIFAEEQKYFEPLKDTLQRYGVLKIPNASDYPDLPAIGILSLEEYQQLSSTHERRAHHIVKILTRAGKNYTMIALACFGSCRLEARTIKADGRIINLPSRDLIRSQQRTTYAAPVALMQFALPAVEPGDIVEWRSTVIYPEPFFAEDYRFGERYPIMKAVFSLISPDDTSYSSYRYQPPGTSALTYSHDSFRDNSVNYTRQTYIAENVPALPNENDSADIYAAQPGIRIFIDQLHTVPIKDFKDWWAYAEFISNRFQVNTLLKSQIKPYLQQVIGNETDPARIVNLIYQAADKRIEIVNQKIPIHGMPFQGAEDVFKSDIGLPEDFALFLATCYKDLKWNVDLVLVNSHRKPTATKESPFPPDLDMVFLNVKTPGGEYLIDCNENGGQPNMISSGSMNRLALGIPVKFTFQQVKSQPYLATMPYRDGNKSHLDVTAQAAGDLWNLDFRWQLNGELQREYVRLLREQGEAELKKEIDRLVRSRIHANVIQTDYKLLTTGLEVTAKATMLRRKVNDNLEIFQNDLWDSGFHVRQQITENRITPMLLPIAGELSATYRIPIQPGMNVVFPQSRTLDCAPAVYTLTSTKTKQELQINEKMTIKDAALTKENFDQFGHFLDDYQSAHLWTIFLSPNFRGVANAQ